MGRTAILSLNISRGVSPKVAQQLTVLLQIAFMDQHFHPVSVSDKTLVTTKRPLLGNMLSSSLLHNMLLWQWFNVSNIPLVLALSNNKSKISSVIIFLTFDELIEIQILDKVNKKRGFIATLKL